MLRSALKSADAREYLPRGNVALLAEMPQSARKQRGAPDPDRVSRLLATVEDDPPLRAFVLLCLGGGLRLGEVLGLTWGAVNLETGQLTVRARVNRVRKELGGLMVRPGAKSEAGKRLPYVAPFVLEALRRLRSAVRAGRLRAGVAWQGADDAAGTSAQVFVTSHGTIWGPEDAGKSFKRACEKAGLAADTSFHGLRHDFASLLARLGVPLRGDGHARAQPRTHDGLLSARFGQRPPRSG